MPAWELVRLVWPRGRRKASGLGEGTQILVGLVGRAQAFGFYSEKMGVFGGFGAPSDLV